VTEKFVCVVKTSLYTLSQLLEVASLVDVSKYAEELLSYMCSTIGPDPVNTVLCVQQVYLFIRLLIFRTQGLRLQCFQSCMGSTIGLIQTTVLCVQQAS